MKFYCSCIVVNQTNRVFISTSLSSQRRIKLRCSTTKVSTNKYKSTQGTRGLLKENTVKTEKFSNSTDKKQLAVPLRSLTDKKDSSEDEIDCM